MIDPNGFPVPSGSEALPLPVAFVDTADGRCIVYERRPADRTAPVHVAYAPDGTCIAVRDTLEDAVSAIRQEYAA